MTVGAAGDYGGVESVDDILRPGGPAGGDGHAGGRQDYVDVTVDFSSPQHPYQLLLPETNWSGLCWRSPRMDTSQKWLTVLVNLVRQASWL